MGEYLETREFTIEIVDEDLGTTRSHARILPKCADLLGVATIRVDGRSADEPRDDRNGGEGGKGEGQRAVL